MQDLMHICLDPLLSRVEANGGEVVKESIQEEVQRQTRKRSSKRKFRTLSR